MYALTVGNRTPRALVDWNNNYGSDPDKCVFFHCCNLPKHFFRSVKMDFQEIIAGTVGKENTFGTCVGLDQAGEDELRALLHRRHAGKMRGYVGEGSFTDDPLNTFGGAGVVEIPQMQKLLHFICENGFEHHVAANLSTVADAVYEATTRYLGWDMYGTEDLRSQLMAIVAGVDFGTLSVRVSLVTASEDCSIPRSPNIPCIASVKIPNTPPNRTRITCARWPRPPARH